MRNDPAGGGKPSFPVQRLAALTWRLSVRWTDSQLDGDGKGDVNLNGNASGETSGPKFLFQNLTLGFSMPTG